MPFPFLPKSNLIVSICCFDIFFAVLTMEDFAIKETTPNIPAMNGSMLPGTALDIVEQMDFFFIKVFNARGFLAIDGPYIANP